MKKLKKILFESRFLLYGFVVGAIFYWAIGLTGLSLLLLPSLILMTISGLIIYPFISILDKKLINNK